MKIPHHSRLKCPTVFNRRGHILALASALLTILSLSAPYAHAQQSKTIQLNSIEFSGLQRITKEQAIAASGLKIGQRVDVDALDAAAQKLLNSGLFTKLSYRLRGTSEQGSVTFQVEEAKGGNVPVVFDNFVWFTDEELAAAVRKEVPTFDGTAPESSGVIESITRALQQLLQTRNIQGQVNYTPSASLSGGNAKHVFSVTGSSLKICAVRFPGSAGVQESELITNSKTLFENEYSQEFVSAYASANLIPVYRRHGHLRASFREPSAKVEASAGDCKGGVAVTLPVNEGVSYLWDKAEWTGTEAFTPDELESPLTMKPGEVANGLKIDAGIRAVERTYGKRGFITARAKTEAVYDDANRRVTYRINITEGPKYRMGTLKITGLDEIDAERLKGRWKLKQSEAYDATYIEEFIKKEVDNVLTTALMEGRLRPGARLKVENSVKPNRDNLNVDVQIDFKN